ncbi:MAG TPA: Gfo/Idh/MocA family oxidoreductase [Bryobacteraceae bacterium]|nr:Gfo/Idh/MocA family oxidoreductase [Bryobacteraceae bacterium]
MDHSHGVDTATTPSRRSFLKTAVAASTAGLAATPGYVAASDTIRVGVIGCGGRGTEAAEQAMAADKGVRLVAMADLLIDRAQEKRNLLRMKNREQVMVDDDHCFSGFEGYKKVIESSDVVLIANAAKFHPFHMTAAIEAGKHVFVEKPHAIDPAGIKAVRAACELAKQKNLCVVSGLQSRYHPGYRETIQRVYDGAIGDIVAIEENFLRAPYVLYPRKPGQTEVQYQGSNQYHFHWLSGDDVPQSLVHNLDRASWAMHNQAPVKCHGMGGRSTLHGEIYGSVFDHHAVVYEFANGVRIYAFCRTIPECYNDSSSTLLGAKGRCNITKMTIEGETKWQYAGPRTYSSTSSNPYYIEHAELFKAIRAGTPLNNGDYMARSTLMGIMGQISCYTGKEVTWEQISASDFYFAPKPEDVRIDMEPPVKPGPDGTYPVFTPGVTKLL